MYGTVSIELKIRQEYSALPRRFQRIVNVCVIIVCVQGKSLASKDTDGSGFKVNEATAAISDIFQPLIFPAHVST